MTKLYLQQCEQCKKTFSCTGKCGRDKSESSIDGCKICHMCYYDKHSNSKHRTIDIFSSNQELIESIIECSNLSEVELIALVL